ncbi:SAM-dependent methyltransferase [Thermodesulfobacteriota bacterium]
MALNKLYFIGAGPGMKDLITIRGHKALTGSKSVFLADSYKESFADLLTDKTLYSPFEYLFEDITRTINELLEDSDVSFLVPGDSTLFSPFQAIIDHFKDVCEVIPGVSTLNAASASLMKTLDQPNISSSTIITSPRSISKTDFTKSLSDLLRKDSTLVLFMNNLPAEKLREELSKKYAPDTPVAILHRVSMPDEEIVTTTVTRLPDDIDDEKYFNIGKVEPCMSIIIVGDVINAKGSPKFWDFRKINIWDKRNEM